MKNLLIMFLFIGTLNAQNIYIGGLLDNSLISAEFGIKAETDSNPKLGIDLNFISPNEDQERLLFLYSELGVSIRPYIKWKLKSSPSIELGTSNGQTLNIRCVFLEKISGKVSYEIGAGWDSKDKASIFARVYLF